MNVSALQVSGAMMLAVLGGMTAGQYSAKRRTLRGVAFGYWCDRRFALLFMLAAVSAYLPDMLREGAALASNLFGR